ncbi:MAG: 5-oxoprolinase subunit B family protein [Planctomycetia bacterium]
MPAPLPDGLTLAWVGGHALRVQVAGAQAEERGERVHALRSALAAAQLPGVQDLVPAWDSLLVVLDEAGAGLEQLEARVADVLAEGLHAAALPRASRTVVLAVCTCPACAPDRDSVAAACGLPPGEVTARLLAPTYRVQLLGFAPGFPYLHGLDPRLGVPRLPSPRARVPAGSVAVAGAQAGIYPAPTPGGWRLLGRTATRLFDAQHVPPALLAPGDHLRLEAGPHAPLAALDRAAGARAC